MPLMMTCLLMPMPSTINYVNFSAPYCKIFSQIKSIKSKTAAYATELRQLKMITTILAINVQLT